MPLYTYRHKKTGTIVVAIRSIAQRDGLRGHKRVPEFPTAAPPGTTMDPDSEAAGTLRGLREAEEKHGTAEVCRQLGPDLPIDVVKKIWSKK